MTKKYQNTPNPFCLLMVKPTQNTSPIETCKLPQFHRLIVRPLNHIVSHIRIKLDPLACKNVTTVQIWLKSVSHGLFYKPDTHHFNLLYPCEIIMEQS